MSYSAAPLGYPGWVIHSDLEVHLDLELVYFGWAVHSHVEVRLDLELVHFGWVIRVTIHLVPFPLLTHWIWHWR